MHIGCAYVGLIDGKGKMRVMSVDGRSSRNVHWAIIGLTASSVPKIVYKSANAFSKC
jgi:hypothetical protein